MRRILAAFLLLWPTIANAEDDIDQSVMVRVWDETEIVLPLRHAPDLERDELICLALNVYHEARGSTLLDKIGTAFVAMNRLDKNYRGAETVCEVVWQRKQFSWTHDGKSDIPKESAPWRESQMLAFMVWKSSNFDLNDHTEGSTHYVRYDIFDKVSWTKNAKSTVQYGYHIYMVK